MAGYAVAAWLGARTAHGNDGIALAWPASGVALAWIAGTSPRLRPAELGLLGVLAAVAAYGMDHTVWDALNAGRGKEADATAPGRVVNGGATPGGRSDALARGAPRRTATRPDRLEP